MLYNSLLFSCSALCVFLLIIDFVFKLWQFATKQPVFSSPALAIYPSPTSPPSKQVIFCGSHDGCVYCLNCEDGGLEWFSPESDKSSLPPIYATPFPATISFQDKVSISSVLSENLLRKNLKVESNYIICLGE